MRTPSETVESGDLRRRLTSSDVGRLTFKAEMNPILVIVVLEAIKLALKVCGVPEQRLVQVFASNRSDGSLDKWMR